MPSSTFNHRALRLQTFNRCLWLLALSCLPGISTASPWVEANDPFLRSSLVLLSDAGQLSSPTNHYPLRWSLLGDDFGNASLNTDVIDQANRQLLYRMNSVRLGRGSRTFKALASSDAATPSGFGQFSEDKQGLYTSIEHMRNDFSYRLSAGYSEYQGDTDFNIDDSYFTFNAGAWLWSIGNIDRWWGQGWQHNLILGSYAKAAPDVSVGYTGENPLLGVWSLETLVAKSSNGDYDYHSATRLVSKPWRYFEYGLTYQRWLADRSRVDDDEQMAIDAKLTLPAIASVYHSVYAEAASTAITDELGAWLVGWTGSFPMGPHTVRLVLESQQSTDEHDTTPWNSGHYPSITDQVANTSYLLDDSTSMALYLQLANDHQIGLSAQSSEQDQISTKITRLIYNLPALAGKVRLGADVTQTDDQERDTSVWAGYEFRF